MNLPLKIKDYILSNKGFLLALLGVHAFYFVSAFLYDGICTQDSDEYLQTAENLKYHFESYNWVWAEERNPAFYSLRPPFYGMVIFLCKLVFNSDYFVLFVQNGMSLFIWILTLHLGKVLKLPFKISFPIIICLILFPSQMIMVNSIMADVTFELLLLLCLTFVVYYVKTEKSNYLVWYNVVLTLAVFTKPLLVYFWIPNMLFCLYLFSRNKHYSSLISCLLMPCAIFLWSLRNEYKTGYFHFSSIKVQGILELNAGGVLAILHGVDEGEKIREQISNESDKIDSYSEKCRFIEDTSMAIIKEHPALYAYTHVKGMLNFMLAMGRSDTKIFFNHNSNETELSLVKQIELMGFVNGFSYYFSHVNAFSVVMLLLGTFLNVVILISILVFVFNRELPLILVVFICSMVFYCVFVSGPGGYARYRVSLLPYLILTLPFLLRVIQNLFQKFIHKQQNSI